MGHLSDQVISERQDISAIRHFGNKTQQDTSAIRHLDDSVRKMRHLINHYKRCHAIAFQTKQIYFWQEATRPKSFVVVIEGAWGCSKGCSKGGLGGGLAPWKGNKPFFQQNNDLPLIANTFIRLSVSRMVLFGKCHSLTLTSDRQCSLNTTVGNPRTNFCRERYLSRHSLLSLNSYLISVTINVKI